MELTQLVVQTIAVAAIIKLTLIFTFMNFGVTNKILKNRRQVINLKINEASRLFFPQLLLSSTCQKRPLVTILLTSVWFSAFHIIIFIAC